MHRFYVNLYVVSLVNPVMNICSKKENFRAEQINAIYDLPNADMGKIHAKGYKTGTWMADILYPRKKCPRTPPSKIF